MGRGNLKEIKNKLHHENSFGISPVITRKRMGRINK
jgi:hypothetical protein